MSVKTESIIDNFIGAIKESKEKTSPYDTTAEVLRVDGDTVWVHISGGVDETPIRKTINCNKGDMVQLRVGGGDAWIVGNATAPPTDDKTAIIAQGYAINAEEKADDAYSLADNAYVLADTAKTIADDTNQYFWHTQEGTDTGAHITEIPQEEFLKDPSNGGGNLLARSNGVAIRDGLEEIATFGETSRIGREDSSNLEITPYELVFNTPEVESAVAMLPIPSTQSSISQGGVIKFGAEDYGEALSITGQKNNDGSSNLDIEGFYKGSTGHSSVVSMKSRHQDANGVDIDEARVAVGCNEPLVELSATDYNSNKHSTLLITPDDGVKTDSKVTVMGHTSAIGTIKSVTPPSSVTVPTSTPSAISSITLDEGTWIITANVRFPAMGTNSAVVYANISPTAGDTALQYRAPSQDSIIAIQLTYIVNVTSDSKPYYLNVYQSSGSNKSFSTSNTLRAVRIA